MPSLESLRFNPNYVFTEQDKIANARREHYERMITKFDVYEAALKKINEYQFASDEDWGWSYLDIMKIARIALSEGE